MEEQIDEETKRMPADFSGKTGENICDLFRLYAEHEVKEEIVIGPAIYQQTPQQLLKTPQGSDTSKRLSSTLQPVSDHTACVTHSFVCDVCDEQCTNEDELIQHLNQHEELDYFCTKCEETYCNEVSFREHKDYCRRLNVSEVYLNGGRGMSMASNLVTCPAISEKDTALLHSLNNNTTICNVINSKEKSPICPLTTTHADVVNEKEKDCNLVTNNVNEIKKELEYVHATHVIVTETKNGLKICPAPRNVQVKDLGPSHPRVTAVYDKKKDSSECSLLKTNAATPVVIEKEKDIEGNIEPQIKEEPADLDGYKETRQNVSTYNEVQKEIGPTELQKVGLLREKILQDPVKQEKEIKQEIKSEPETERLDSPTDRIHENRQDNTEQNALQCVAKTVPYTAFSEITNAFQWNEKSNTGMDSGYQKDNSAILHNQINTISGKEATIETQQFNCDASRLVTDTASHVKIIRPLLDPMSTVTPTYFNYDARGLIRATKSHVETIRPVLQDPISTVTPTGFNCEASGLVRYTESHVEIIRPVLEDYVSTEHRSDRESAVQSRLYCEACKRYFCTHSILALHHRFHHRLQLCSCEVCETCPTVPVLPTNSNTAIPKTDDNQKQTKSRMHSPRIISKGGSMSQSKIHPSQTTLDKGPISISSDEEMEVLDEEFLEYGGNTEDFNGRNIRDMDPSHCTPSIYYGFPAAAPRAPAQYHCGACVAVFTQRDRLMAHMRLHTTDKPYVCAVCCKQFAKLYTLNVHKETHNFEKRKCPNCAKLFNSTPSLSRHKLYFCKAKTNTNRYVCDRCDKEYSTGGTLKHHKKYYCYDRTQDMPYKCDVCNNAFPELHMLAYHKKRHGQVYTCDYCKRDFGNRYHLQRHFLVHTGVKHFSCKFCKKKYARKTRLVIHEMTHTHAKSHICDVCEKGFYDAKNLKRHKREMCNEKMLKQKPFLCDMCKRRFVSKMAVARHITNNHLKKFTCDICDRSFGQSCNLVHHMEIHSKKKLCCAVCKKKFKRTKSLIYHEQKHPDAVKKYSCNTCDRKFIHRTTLLYHDGRCRKIHQCDDCDKSFISKNRLFRHKQMCKVVTKNRCQCDICKRRYKSKRAVAIHIAKYHSKNFTCDICNKTLSQKCHLVLHLKSHRSNLLSCNVCNEKFSRVRRLVEHERRHNVMKNYSCEQCDQKFIHKPSLVFHIKRYHKRHKKYSCLNCHKTFKHHSDLTYHKKRDCDKGDRNMAVTNFSCASCDTKFTNKSALVYHKIHRCGKGRNRLK